VHRAVLIVLVVALGSTPPAIASAGTIDLRITYRATAEARPTVRTLRCNPARGTVARPARACRRLRVLGPDAFAPTPRDRVYTQIVGGPMTALVTGSYYGRRVWAMLALTDGCAIARWNGLAFLFPLPR
jgi:Subtilisin inhibitor-like